MRIIFLFLLVIISQRSNEQIKNPFLSLKFDHVVMYDYEPNLEDPSLVGENGQILKAIKIKNQVRLDLATAKKLNEKIGDKKSYGQITAMCFEPHLGIVYYLNGKIVRNVLVCMSCNILEADIDIPAQHQDKQEEGDSTAYLGKGMSKDFRRFINDLLVKYNFSHQIRPGSDFNK